MWNISHAETCRQNRTVPNWINAYHLQPLGPKTNIVCCFYCLISSRYARLVGSLWIDVVPISHIVIPCMLRLSKWVMPQFETNKTLHLDLLEQFKHSTFCVNKRDTNSGLFPFWGCKFSKTRKVRMLVCAFDSGYKHTGNCRLELISLFWVENVMERKHFTRILSIQHSV